MNINPPCSYDGGYINASAEGVSIRTALQLSRDSSGRIDLDFLSSQGWAPTPDVETELGTWASVSP